jgi:hypothetical protein
LFARGSPFAESDAMCDRSAGRMVRRPEE